MKLEEIDAFVAVVGCESLNQAADTLGLTQPAVTRRIQNFEEALGVALLDRQTKPLKPTQMGRVVYDQCRVIVREIDALRDLVADDTPLAGVLRLGVAQTVADIALLDGLRELRQAYPGVQARVSTGWGAQLLQRLEDGALDAAVMLMPDNKRFAATLTAESLGRIKLAVIAPRGRFKKTTQTLAHCAAHGWVLNPDGCGFRNGLQRALADQGLSLKLNLETLGSELQIGLVADGAGLGLVPQRLVQQSAYADRVDLLTVSDFKPAIDVWMVRPARLGKLQSAVSGLADSIARSFKAARVARAA